MSLEIVKQVRAKYREWEPPVATMLVEIAQKVGGGAGLLRKETGARVPYGDTSIAGDIICFPDGRHIDVFADWEGVAEPQWSDLGYVNSNRYISVDGQSVPQPGPPETPSPDPNPGSTPIEPGSKSVRPYKPKYADTAKVGKEVLSRLSKLRKVPTGRKDESLPAAKVAAAKQAVANIAQIVVDFSLDKASEAVTDKTQESTRAVTDAEKEALDNALNSYTKTTDSD